jgi:acylphosphatase
MKRLKAIVRGRVQGVGFRDATARTARQLGVQGWVRNRADGTVEVLAEGGAEALAQLEAFLRTGPRFAEVTDLELSWPDQQQDRQQDQQQDQKDDSEAFRIRF